MRAARASLHKGRRIANIGMDNMVWHGFGRSPSNIVTEKFNVVLRALFRSRDLLVVALYAGFKSDAVLYATCVPTSLPNSSTAIAKAYARSGGMGVNDGIGYVEEHKPSRLATLPSVLRGVVYTCLLRYHTRAVCMC